MGNVSIFESLLDLLLENDQFVLHFRIDVALVVCGPEAPEGVANDVAEAGLLLAEDVLAELRQYVLPLQQLLADLLLLPQLSFIQDGLILLHRVRYRWHRYLLVADRILKDQLLYRALVSLILSSLLIVLAASVHRRVLRPCHRVHLLISQSNNILTGGRCLARTVSRLARPDLLVLHHLPLKLDSIRQGGALRPLLTLRILLVYLFQVYLVMLILLMAHIVPSTGGVVV